jgi:hypothetical protein
LGTPKTKEASLAEPQSLQSPQRPLIESPFAGSTACFAPWRETDSVLDRAGADVL